MWQRGFSHAVTTLVLYPEYSHLKCRSRKDKVKSIQWWILWNTSSCAPITLCNPSLKIKQQTYLVTKVTTVLSTFSQHKKEGGSFWGFFQMLILKHAAGMSNYYFFKSKFLLPRLIFFIPSHGNFSKVCRQKTHCSGWSRWHNKICDRLKIPHTRTSCLWYVFIVKNIWTSAAVSQSEQTPFQE